MIRVAALLRGVNVGGNNKLPMAQLRALLERLGHRDVVTLLQSGNAVFSSKEKSEAKLVRQLEGALAAELGLEVPVLVRTGEDLAAVVENNPLEGADAEPSKFLVAFLAERPAPDRLALLEPADYLPDELAVGTREIYARLRGGIHDSKLGKLLLSGKRLGVAVTARNWATVRKLRELTAVEAAGARQTSARPGKTGSKR